MEELRRQGIVVAISGGLDSSTVAALCTRSIGKAKVTGLMLPEKQGNPEAVLYGRLICRHLGIRQKTINISRLTKTLGCYDFILSRIPTRKARAKAVKTILSVSKQNPFLDCMRRTATPLYYKGMAVINSKHRLRLAVTYKYAEENNLMVVGCAHKSEDMVGLYVKFGIDDNADVMPLKNLYRSQILQLARFSGVPAEITTRTPNPDMMDGITDKYQDILGIPGEKLDLILYGLANNLSCREIAGQLGLPDEKITEIREIINLTYHMRHPSLTPEL